MENQNNQPGLYSPQFEHDNCGIGAVVSIKGVKTHQTVSDALSIVENLEHRAGKDAEGKTGDGVGILLQISHKFFKKAVKPLGIKIGEEREYGVGMFFFPQDELARNRAKKMFEIIVEKEGLEFLGWREVPTFPNVLGKKAVDCMPYIMQGFVKKPKDVNKGIDFDRKLYVARRVFEQTAEDTYVCSLSSRTIVYKGMFLVGQLRTFFKDLVDEDYESAIALVHSRFSTNTNPSWERAHPNRFIVHNGEINTIKGNADRMLSREETMVSPYLEDEMSKITPVVNTNGSDSAMLDNTLEFFVMNGMPLPLAVMITIPEPWSNNKAMEQEKKDFYQYYATMMEPWDGPASILFSDGDIMGAVLDRNGLRPSRYYITNDGYLILSSEVGALPIDESRIKVKDRLHPGKMLLVDTVKGELIDDDKLKEQYATKQPYGEWLDNNLINLCDLKIPNKKVPTHTKEERARLQKAFGYTYEDFRTSILPMALNGAESIGAMGIDTPLAVLSNRHQPLFNYFKQLFAQVTNPPIDSIREKIVTSTTVYLGKDGNVLEEKPENCKNLKINNPILTNTDILKLKNDYRNKVFRTNRDVNNLNGDIRAKKENYNRNYNISLAINENDNFEFNDEWERIKNISLPQYKDKIAVARKESMEQFQSDFLDKMRDNIMTAQQQIKEINEALKLAEFGSDKYSFEVKPEKAYMEYYNMIMADRMGGDSIFDLNFQQQYGDTCNNLFDKITSVSDQMTEESRKELDNNISLFTDYRTYLKFDLYVTNATGRKESLVNGIKSKSGGERQTPFYVSFLATFAQLYKVNEFNYKGNTARLVIFDEAFNNMDNGRIDESIELLRKLGLQAIICAPDNKIANISTKADKTLVLYREGRDIDVFDFDKEMKKVEASL